MNTVTPQSLHRRQFLKATGISMALPPLTSLNHYLRAAVPAQGHPETGMKMVCVGNSFGMYADAFFPKASGRDYQAPRLIEPHQRFDM